MKTYMYRTDGEISEVEADSLQEALEAACREAHVTDFAIADGGWCWVQDPATEERLERGIVG